MSIQNDVTSEEIDRCIQILQRLTADATLAASVDYQKLIELTRAAGRFSRPDKNAIRLQHKALYAARRARGRAEDRRVRSTTGIREARKESVFRAPAQIVLADGKNEERVLRSARNCYVCKAEFTRLHFFYDLMCADCAEFNYKKRFQSASLHGQVAVITGARLKIGFRAALMMLRAGAKVIATSRFPVDAANRFSREADFHDWSDRLQVHGLDLRHTPSVEIFSRYLCNTIDRLDILINNAAQTVRRPPGFYAHLIERETAAFADLPIQVQALLSSSEACNKQLASLCVAAPETSDSAALVAWQSQGPGIGLRASALLSQIPYAYDGSSGAAELFPAGELDCDLQQVDLREKNSWRLKLADVAAPEMLEV